jgi:hypothetical protein
MRRVMGSRALMNGVLACLCWSTSAASAEDWATSGREGGAYVAVNMEGIPRDRTEPFYATVAMIPLDWPANHNAYRLMIVQYDCNELRRTVTSRIDYSGLHDPRTVEISPRTERAADSPAVASQLSLVCNGPAEDRERYTHLGAFVGALRR